MIGNKLSLKKILLELNGLTFRWFHASGYDFFLPNGEIIMPLPASRQSGIFL
jgi:hypothetical protein